MKSEKTANITAIPFEELKCGFQYGAAKVTRMCSDEKKGWIVLNIETPKSSIQVYVTKTGKIRIHDKEGEWFRLSKDWQENSYLYKLHNTGLIE